jgi:Ca-activated chloride channel family protein
MKKIYTTIIFILTVLAADAQKENAEIAKGNKAYKEQEYQKAVSAYKNALMVAPNNNIARFNLGNAIFRNSNPAEAEKVFDETIEGNHSRELTASAWYNKGVTLTNQKKLEESIKAYKQALRLNPNDTLARENLVRALRELQKKQDQDKDQKKKQDQDKKQQKEKEKQQQKMNKQQVQQLLQALEEQEKKLQQKMNQTKIPAPSQPDKDW